MGVISEQKRSEEPAAASAALIEMLQESAVQIEEAGMLTPDVLEAMDEVGIWKIYTPASHGGTWPIPTRTETELLVNLGRGNASAAWVTWVTGINARFVQAAWPEEVVDEVFGTDHIGPLVAGSAANPAISKGLARPVDGGYAVTGRWGFASGVRNAAWFSGRAAVQGSSDGAEHIVFQLPRSDYEIADDWYVEGMKGTNSNSVSVPEEVFVPAARALPMGEFVSRAIPKMGSVFIPPIVLGCAKTALEQFARKAKRGVFGPPYGSLGEMPTAQVAAGRARADICLLEALLERNTEALDRALAGEITLEKEEMTTMRQAEVRASDLVRSSVEGLQLAAGSATALQTDGLGRCCRDIRVMCLQVQMRELWGLEQMGRSALDQEPWPSFME